jgi:ABC-type lipoprotein export system ATPase subunit
VSDQPYSIRSIQVQAFRAYLQPKTFDFTRKRCLAVFAPNGSGKSSLIDALEFMFSKDGTLTRLGLRAVNNQSGALALVHNLAEEKKIDPHVAIEFSSAKERMHGVRYAGPGRRLQPAAATVVGACFAVNPIIRGHELRGFVEAHKTEDRYAEFANWLQLSPLVEIQKNLRSLRQSVKAAAEDLSALRRVDKDLGKETANTLASWDAGKALIYVNEEVLAPLDKALQLTALDRADQALHALAERAAAEEQQIGLAGLRQIRTMAASVYEANIDPETGALAPAGAVLSFERAAARKAAAANGEIAERDKAEKASFATLWKAAEPLFAEGAPRLDACPVCATPMDETKAGGVDGVRSHLAGHLGELAAYAKAKQELDGAAAAATRAHGILIAKLPALSKLLEHGHGLAKAATDAYLAAVEAWADSPPPASAEITSALQELLTELDARIAEIEARQGECTYGKAKAKIESILELQAEHAVAMRTKVEMESLSQALATQAAFISSAIRKEVQALLDTLQQPANEIYAEIQGERAVPIRLELPPEDDTNQQRLNLVIDFAENRTGVQPGGFLSDSQIHSVALALRLAAIKRFNAGAPIIALDDVVNSYDADHRRAIVAMLGKQCAECQLIITTHDRRFFDYLKDQLHPNDWQFTHITRIDRQFGPIFADHKITDEMIEARWEAGESAANEMRQAEEEWLLAICRGFGVDVRIRPLERPYSFERGELASALASFLNGLKLEPELVPGVNNRFLASLQQGLVENFGSHFQDSPYAGGSVGDERARWKEFKAFRSQFACPRCSRQKFLRPSILKKPVCAHPACEAQFEFVQSAQAEEGKAA